MKLLLFVLNSFEAGAIPNILLDIAPAVEASGFRVRFLAIEQLDEAAPSVRRCRQAGYNLETLNKHPRNVVGSLVALRRRLRKIGPDVIHSHLGRADIYCALVKPRGTPLVTTFHSVWRNYSRFTGLGYRLTDSLVTYRTGVSGEVVRTFYGPWTNGEERPRLRSRHKVIYNPVAGERLRPQKPAGSVLAEFGIEGCGPILVAAGRFVEAKGLPALVEALPAVLEAYPNAKLILSGSGPLEPLLRELAETNGSASSIVWPGFYSSVPDLLVAADLLVFPSLWEGFGLVPVEAALCGLPAVVADIPAVREIFGEWGSYFKPGDRHSIAKAVVSSLTNLERCRQILAEHVPDLREKVSAGSIAAQYVDVYKEALVAGNKNHI